jgi:hypothetical protein
LATGMWGVERVDLSPEILDGQASIVHHGCPDVARPACITQGCFLAAPR